jgi:hypothetical protein
LFDDTGTSVVSSDATGIYAVEFGAICTLVWCQSFANSIVAVDTPNLVTIINLHWSKRGLRCFKRTVKSFLVHWLWQTWSNPLAHHSTVAVYSSWAPDPTSSMYRGSVFIYFSDL